MSETAEKSVVNPDEDTPLWPIEGGGNYFAGKVVRHIHQNQKKGYGCVPTCLAMLEQMKQDAGREKDAEVAAAIAKRINTQDPRAWSEELMRHGMKLAYLPTDVRPLEMYLKDFPLTKTYSCCPTTLGRRGRF
jgi:hypothetical protein